MMGEVMLHLKRQAENSHHPSLVSQITVSLVRMFGSWASVILHSLFFAGWFYFKLELEVLLVIVSLEAIYIGIFILMAENVETAQREHFHQLQRDADLRIIKKDARVDEKALKELKKISDHLHILHQLIDKN